MAEGSGLKNGNLIDTKVSIGQIGIIISIVCSALIFYFTGQTNVGERINKLESDLNQRMQTSLSSMSDRVGKNETRIAVIEQHQIQGDSAIADVRTNLNAFIVDVRQQLGRIVDQVSDLRPLLQSRDGQGTNVRTR